MGNDHLPGDYVASILLEVRCVHAYVCVGEHKLIDSIQRVVCGFRIMSARRLTILQVQLGLECSKLKKKEEEKKHMCMCGIV